MRQNHGHTEIITSICTAGLFTNEYCIGMIFKQRNQTITFHVGAAIQGKNFHSELPEFRAAQEFKKEVYSIKEKLS